MVNGGWRTSALTASASVASLSASPTNALKMTAPRYCPPHGNAAAPPPLSHTTSSLCIQGMQPIRRPGDCCPICLPGDQVCTVDGTIHNSGDIWQTGCEYCSCDRGSVRCEATQCGSAQCQPVSYLSNSL